MEVENQEAQGTTEGSTETTGLTVEGEGETVQPDTLYANKYKSVDELVKGYENLQSKLGSHSGAPEEYTVNEGIEVDQDNPLFSKLQEVGKELGLNNDGYNALIDMYNGTIADQQAQHEESMKAEMAKLGDNANERIQNLADWSKANLSEAERNVFDSLAQNAEAVQLIEKFVSMSKPQGVANDQQIQKAPSFDQDKLNEMRFAKDANGNRRMSTDPAYRDKVLALEQQYA